MTKPPITGLHHVTAICRDARANHDFYTRVLGLRLVKQTVNYDDPRGSHLYYGDAAGTPGSVLTFFPLGDLPPAREGTGQVSAVAFAVNERAFADWQKRLVEHGVEFRGPMQRFDEVYLEFADPDGIKLELVIADQTAAFQPWPGSSVPREMQVRGFHSVTLAESGYALTDGLLGHQMGWSKVKEAAGRTRYQAPGAGAASLVDVLSFPAARSGLAGNGSVHHVAFRVSDEAAQASWRAALEGLGHHVSPVKDRGYFHSIYYREPGGVLFEIATEGPGFLSDEPLETLGSRLMLPAKFEPAREQLEKLVPIFGA